jgi:hypothetical protein
MLMKLTPDCCYVIQHYLLECFALGRKFSHPTIVNYFHMLPIESIYTCR